jgi:hypothetical protein
MSAQRRTLVAMDETPPWELERPDLLLTALREHVAFDRPSTYLVRVDREQDVQHLADWTLLWSEPPLHEYPDRRRLTDDALERLETSGLELVPYRERPLVVPVVVRPGTRAWTFDETEVMLALRYSFSANAFMQEGPLLVTASGWWMPFAKLGGRAPRACWSAHTVETLTNLAPY